MSKSQTCLSFCNEREQAQAHGVELMMKARANEWVEAILHTQRVQPSFKPKGLNGLWVKGERLRGYGDSAH